MVDETHCKICGRDIAGVGGTICEICMKETSPEIRPLLKKKRVNTSKGTVF